jgi:RNA polymerase sigma-70 factor (ECF subfamily)
MEETGDLSVIRRCLEGDKEAFAELVDRYQSAVFNVALRMVGRYEDAQDIAQTVFLKAYANLRNYNPRFKFFSWIFRMAVNESINWINRMRPEDLSAAGHSSAAEPPDQKVTNSEFYESLEDAMQALRPEHRTVIILKHFADLSYRQISETLQLPEKTIKSRLFEARRQLCAQLTQRGVTAYE